MGFHIIFIIVILSLLAGMISILLANRIMKKYQESYLSSYFYFLVFVLIFSTYSVIGSRSLVLILNNHNAPVSSIRSTEAIMIALGIPFLILSWYMFIRLSREFFKKELPPIFVVFYIAIFALSFIGYTFLNLDIGGMEAIQYFMDEVQLTITFAGLNILAFLYGLIFMYKHLEEIKDYRQRSAFRWFTTWYLVYAILISSSLILSNWIELAGLVFVVILTAFHLIPTLFINIYLQQHYVKHVEQDEFKEKLASFCKKYEISKRETEIIELICKGMTNQEISDSLFISLQTVKDHVHRIFLKTGVKNRIQLSNMVSSN